MSEDDASPECNSEFAALPQEKEQARTFKFDLIQRGDFVKPGWWHWRCRREDSSGYVSYGYVHADALGATIVSESFEEDRW